MTVADNKHWVVWTPIILSCVQVVVALAVVYVYACMLQITLSTEQFEVIPSYVVAAMQIACGILLFIAGQQNHRNLFVVRLAGLTAGATILTVIIAATMTLWLADRQDKRSVCIYSKEEQICMCHFTAFQLQSKGIVNAAVYKRIRSCLALDSLFNLMIAIVALFAFAAFACFLEFWYLCAMVKNFNAFQSEEERISSATSARTVTSNYPLSDWDHWILSSPIFSRIFADLRRNSPPTYEQSQEQPNYQCALPNVTVNSSLTSVTCAAPPSYRSRSSSESSNKV